MKSLEVVPILRCIQEIGILHDTSLPPSPKYLD